MQTENFWRHWRVTDDPFRAEEARDDPIFMKLVDTNVTHPDFNKVSSQPEQPSAAVVFGEKGSGKTALRLLLENAVNRHNAKQPDRKAWVVRYDDWNPILDRFAHSVGEKGHTDLGTLQKFSLADHQDAILSRAVTRLVDAALGEDEADMPTEEVRQRLRDLPPGKRVDLATLAALYDAPRTGNFTERWGRLRRLLRLGFTATALSAAKWVGGIAALAAAVLFVIYGVSEEPEAALLAIAIVLAVLGAGLLGYWAWRTMGFWSLSRKISRELRTIERQPADLRPILQRIPSNDLTAEPLPLPNAEDSRYQLTVRLLDILKALGYTGLIVLVDRVDEPAMINGDPEKMRAIIWPMLNNKFLQQDGVGIKLLLPIELRHLLRREDEAFFQRARLDKQHMIDRLVWSGTTLYDLCNQRLLACREQGADDGEEGGSQITLADLFDEEVTRQDIIDALDQMQQPRDAFKFLYETIQEHCSNVPDDSPVYRIPRLTLQNVRKRQAQRVQELQRGLSPA